MTRFKDVPVRRPPQTWPTKERSQPAASSKESAHKSMLVLGRSVGDPPSKSWGVLQECKWPNLFRSILKQTRRKLQVTLQEVINRMGPIAPVSRRRELAIRSLSRKSQSLNMQKERCPIQKLPFERMLEVGSLEEVLLQQLKGGQQGSSQILHLALTGQTSTMQHRRLHP